MVQVGTWVGHVYPSPIMCPSPLVAQSQAWVLGLGLHMGLVHDEPAGIQWYT